MNFLKSGKLFFILFLFAPLMFVKAQNKDNKTLNLSGNVFLDSRLAVSDYQIYKEPVLYQESHKKSQYLAGLMSLILPGSGEVYSENYLKGAIFFVVEAAAITTALIYNHKGDFQTAFFQQYADQHWNVVRYAQWTLKNINNINANVDAAQYQAGGSKQVLNTDGSGNVTGVNWGNLNALESDLGSGYSHMLPHQGEQQYYELIGKYPQYSHGWDQSNQSDSDFHILTDQFLWYSHQRGLANEYYKTGSFGVGLIYVNHVLSALDAVWSMDRYNASLAMNIRMDAVQMADHYEMLPTLNLSFNF